MIELDQLLRETDLCVQGLRKYFWQLVPWLVQEQKINTTEFEREWFVSLRLRIFLTASALAGARAKIKHDHVRSIEFDQFLRGTDLWDQVLRIFLTASALAGARAKNEHNRVRLFEFDRSSLVNFRERPIIEFNVCVYFYNWCPGWCKSKKRIQSSSIDQVQSIIERDRFVSSRFAYIFDSWCSDWYKSNK